MWRGNGTSMPPLPGQMMHYDLVGSRANTSMEGIIDESARKRKMVDLEKNSSIYDNGSLLQGRNLIHGTGHIPSQTSSNYHVGRIHVKNTQTIQMHMNQVSPSAQPNNVLPQHGNCPMYSMNKFPVTPQTGGTLQMAKTENSIPHTLPHQETSAPMGNAAVVEIPRLPYSQHFTYNVTGLTETSKPQSHSSGSVVFAGTNQSNLTLQDEKGLQQVSYGTSSLAPSVTSSGSSISAGFSQQMMFNNEVLSHNENLHQKTQTVKSCNAVARAECANTNQIVDVAGSQETVCCSTSSASTIQVAECGKNYESSRSQWPSDDNSVNITSDEVQQGLVRFQTMSAMGDAQFNSGSCFHMSNDSETKISKNQNSLDTRKIHSLREESLSSTIGTLVTNDTRENHSLSSFHGEGKVFTGKTATPIVGALWDGSLQLNASTTASAIAFFKSGEKATNIDWPQYVEVKGKVRLEAFEKFIQELPRSRNRALMVISLCWKVGSSETGLTGIKEVAKGYKEGQRVGYAQLSPGIDLYVCPRSETIITILAKYGFFKGMAAVEEDRDSLIGCVVWRRNLNPLIAALNKSETKNFHPEKLGSSPSESTLQNAEPNSPLTRTQVYEQNQTTLCIKEAVGNSAFHVSTQPEFVASTQNSSESKNIYSSIALPSVANIKTELFGAVPSVQYNPQVVPMQLPNLQYPCISSPQIPVEQRPNMEIPTPMKPDNSAPRSPPPRTSKNSADDDDLPEFDFGTACGSHNPVTSRSQWPRHQDDFSVGPLSKKQKLVEAPIAPAPPISRQMDVASFQVPSSFDHMFSSHQGAAPESKIGEHMNDRRLAPQTTEVTMPPAPPRSRQMDVTSLKAPSSFDRTFYAHQAIAPANKIGEHMNNRRLAAQTMEAPMLPAAPRSRQTDVTLFQASSSFDHTCCAPQGIAPSNKVGDHMNDRKLAAQTMETSGKVVSLVVEKVLARDGANKPSFPRKNLWDDDDDMPEWCPPDLEHEDVPRLLPPLPTAPPPPLPSYPRPPHAAASRLTQPSQILQPTSETAPSWPPLPSHPQLLVQPPNNQGFPQYELGLLGSGSQNNNPRLPQNTGPSPGMHPDETSRSQSSGLAVKPYQRPPPGQNPDRNSKPWHSEFNQEHEERTFRIDQNENLKHRASGFIANPGQKCLPVHTFNETSRRRRPSGFDVLPDHRSSPGFSPKHSSRRRRPSLFDVRPNSSSMDWRGERH